MDAEGVFSFSGLQAQIDRAARIGGEVFIRRRRPLGYTAVPIQIQLLESELVPVALDKKLKNAIKENTDDVDEIMAENIKLENEYEKLLDDWSQTYIVLQKSYSY